jgi:hypothetical protein
MGGCASGRGTKRRTNMKLEAGRYYKALVSINALKDSMEDVTEQLKPHTFPTLVDFKSWVHENLSDIPETYNYFKSRTQPLEIGREYEFSDDGEKWVYSDFRGFASNVTLWKHIRPIQPDPTPKREVVLEAVKNARNAQDGDMVMIHDIIVDAVIKLLEESR